MARWFRRSRSARAQRKSAGEGLLITPEGGGDLAEPFRILRSSLLGFGGGRVMITSALDQEGKSLCASNLAIALSLPRDAEVVLVDLDLRRPTLSDLFEIDGSPGVVDCLLGDASWPDCLRATRYPNLSILPAGRHSHAAPELLASHALRTLMEELRAFAASRFVLIDTPPVLLTADPRTLVEESDQAILVVRAESTPRSAFLEAIETLGSEKLLGVVFNQVRQRAAGYYYYGRPYGVGKASRGPGAR